MLCFERHTAHTDKGANFIDTPWINESIISYQGTNYSTCYEDHRSDVAGNSMPSVRPGTTQCQQFTTEQVSSGYCPFACI